MSAVLDSMKLVLDLMAPIRGLVAATLDSMRAAVDSMSDGSRIEPASLALLTADPRIAAADHAS